MRKEVLAAIIVGFVLGLIITFGIWSASRALTDQKTKLPSDRPLSPTEVPSLSPAPLPSFSLSIVKPENESIVNSEKITLSGNTQPEAQVVVVWENGETLLQADESGSFDTEVSLVSGLNEITITAIAKDGKEAIKTITVVYSTEEI